MSKKRALSLLRNLKVNGIQNEENSLFFGREKILERLHKIDNEHVIGGRHWGVYGIRRSGKTTVIEKFISEAINKNENEGYKCFHLTLTGDNTRSTQENINRAFFALNDKLLSFYEKHNLSLHELNKQDFPEGWDGFFFALKKIIDQIEKELLEVRFYLFFDEVLWFGSRSHFLSSLGYFINNDIMKLNNVSTFIASSSNGWIREKVFQDRNGLHKRFIPLKIPPFSFEEICSLFKLRGWIDNKVEILKYYLLFGGFIKYYNEVKLDYSLPIESNLKNLQDFNLYLKEESENLLQGIFQDKDHYLKIIHEINLNKKASAEDLENTGKFNGLSISTLYRQLKELEMANILQSYNVSTRKYYFCIVPILHFMQTFNLDKPIDLSELNNWRGKMFELFVFQHLEVIKNKLGVFHSQDHLDFKLYNRDFGEEPENKCICQCDIIIEERNKNGNKLKKPKIYLLELKFKPSQNISENDRYKLNERVEILSIYYKELLNIKDCNIIAKMLLPETTRENWVSYL